MTKDLFNIFKNHISNNLAFLKESRLLIAISGGIDSVVLVHLCHELSLNMALAHCNFNLRGKESDGDEDFVIQLADSLDIEAFTESFDTQGYANQYKISVQMAARELRYFWFDELAQQLKFDYILTAHHADDNLETFLINFSRGTGLDGLTGIPPINNKFVRPLLPFSREQIVDYAKANELVWRVDSSNASTKYLRNKLRHEVIPILKEINPSLLQSYQSTINNLSDATDIVEDHLEQFFQEAVVSMEENKMVFKISEFKKQNNPRAYLFETFKDYGFTEWNDALNLLDAQSGKYILSNTHRLIKHRNNLLLSEIIPSELVEILVNDISEEIETPFGLICFSSIDEISDNSATSIYVDRALLKFPLLIRQWKVGDLFYPFGMKGRKKVSKYFKDEKLSLLDKESTLLLCSDNNIVWIINRRADNRYRVTKETKEILKIELK
ncbi:tRNA lysidine(34) synthetase TilS [Seonamhaeicola aphaedonensis]|uniref:tRNA(Ile)-lysidine synthase n=1 Tax=Seonamhaeicola aphaedonensis TaxID=1461338 RepID=A0A3D9H602_9FLAO|nr:tRNA lysidine(34) synthetase TilS [Seonamhaeicola aphaedonensis]RED44930.1 tRNA(Ile)-lysidine synthase [Seonamhaeicola aphaedonensis]